MIVKQLRFILIFMIMVAITIPAALVFAVEPPTPGGEKIVGPTMWAVGVCSASPFFASLRVKKIDDCVVDTDPQPTPPGLVNCPTQSSDLIYYRLPQGSVFNKCNSLNHEPIITKVKNFKVDGDLVSFDAQIMFVVPLNAADGVCD